MSTGKRNNFRTYETDVAVIGGGVAGLFAARSILQQGCHCILLDKGPFGHSGASGINWGNNMSDSFENVEVNDETIKQYMMGYIVNHDGVVQQEYLASLIKESQESRAFELAEKSGTVLERSAKDGKPNGEPCPDTWQHTLFPHILAQYMSKKGLTIYDNTMVLDILQDRDGNANGVVALDTVHGEGILVRCRAVVHAMGNAGWNFGWGTAGAKSTTGKECTGDGVGILLKRGVAWTGFEFLWTYWRNLKPDGIAYSQGIGVGGNEHGVDIMNKNGEFFYRTSEAYQDWPTGPTTWKVAFKELYEGRGFDGYGEKGGDFCMKIDTIHFEKPQYYMRFNRRIHENQDRGLGYFQDRYVPINIEFWDTQELPRLNGKTFEVEGLPGCFIAKSSWTAFLGSSAGGHLAGKSAAKRAKARKRSAVDMDEVNTIIGSAFEALEREPENGIRANTIQHNIQNLVYYNIVHNRSKEAFDEAFAELDRIKKDDLPRMYVPSKSTQNNYEWRQALEVPFMWIYARSFLEAASTRTETRETHFRLDYKDMDNKKWLGQMIYVSMDKDGNFSHTIEHVDDDYLPLDQLEKDGMLPEIGIGDYPQKGNQRVTTEKLGHA